MCRNRLTIRQDRLEAQLLGALEERILTSKMLDYALRRFNEVLKHRLQEIQNHGTEPSALEEERAKLQAQTGRLAEAIAEAGHSPSLLSHLATIEAKLRHVNQQITAHWTLPRSATTEETRSFVLENVMRLWGLLRGDVSRASAALMKHVGQLVLTPEDTPTGSLYEQAEWMCPYPRSV